MSAPPPGASVCGCRWSGCPGYAYDAPRELCDNCGWRPPGETARKPFPDGTVRRVCTDSNACYGRWQDLPGSLAWLERSAARAERIVRGLLGATPPDPREKG